MLQLKVTSYFDLCQLFCCCLADMNFKSLCIMIFELSNTSTHMWSGGLLIARDTTFKIVSKCIYLVGKWYLDHDYLFTCLIFFWVKLHFFWGLPSCLDMSFSLPLDMIASICCLILPLTTFNFKLKKIRCAFIVPQWGKFAAYTTESTSSE